MLHASPPGAGTKVDTDDSGTNSAEGLSRSHNNDDSIIEDQGIELKEISSFQVVKQED